MQVGLVLMNHEKRKETWNMPPPKMGGMDVWIVGLSLVVVVVVDTALCQEEEDMVYSKKWNKTESRSFFLCVFCLIDHPLKCSRFLFLREGRMIDVKPTIEKRDKTRCRDPSRLVCLSFILSSSFLFTHFPLFVF